MQIINNLSESRHLSVLREQFGLADEVYLVSPYLSEDLSDLLGDIDLSALTAIHLVSKINLSAQDQVKQVNAFVSFHDLAERAHVPCWTLRLNDRLHGKLYLFFRNQQPVSALVTSANLTWRGMRDNHEWGFLTSDSAVINELKSQILSTIADYPTLTSDILLKMMLKADRYAHEHPEDARGGRNPGQIDFTDILPERLTRQSAETLSGIWLKPIGVTGGVIDSSEPFSNATQRLSFAIRPVGIKADDLIICYAVGHVSIMGVCRASGEFTNESWGEEDRWPWKIYGENLYPAFGANWHDRNLSITGLVDQFVAASPEATITNAGSKSLGALNFGSDKVRLSNEFGGYVLEKIRDRSRES